MNNLVNKLINLTKRSCGHENYFKSEKTIENVKYGANKITNLSRKVCIRKYSIYEDLHVFIRSSIFIFIGYLKGVQDQLVLQNTVSKN